MTPRGKGSPSPVHGVSVRAKPNPTLVNRIARGLQLRLAEPRASGTKYQYQDQPPANRTFDWDASLFGSNITDERYLADCTVPLRYRNHAFRGARRSHRGLALPCHPHNGEGGSVFHAVHVACFPYGAVHPPNNLRTQ